MVASVDLTRYEPPLEYLLKRIDQLSLLLGQGVDPGFVREEAVTVVQEVSVFCKRRLNLAEVEQRIRNATAIDIDALVKGLTILESAPRDDLYSAEKMAKKFAGTKEHLELLKAQQHKFKFLEVGLRVELLFESVFQDALLAIDDGWDPSSIVDLVRTKVALIPEPRQRDLWSQVISEFGEIDPDEDEELVRDYRLDASDVLPDAFLEPAPADLSERLSLYHGWLRGRVVRAMIKRGRERWPMPAVGLAKLLANKKVDLEPSLTEIVVARAISNIAGWLSLRGERPLSVEQFGALLGISPDSKLLGGEEKQEFASRKWDGKASPEHAALHSLKTLATATASLYEHQTPLAVALFQYKAGVELFAPAIADELSQDELVLQKQLCKFLLERGIFSVGTKFGQSETDLVANVRDDFFVIECKLIKDTPSPTTLARNLIQLLRYDDLNPAFRGSRAVLIVYNFSDVPIMAPRELIAGRAWIVAVNVKAGPPSKTKKCLQLLLDETQGLRCVELGGSSRARS